MLVASKLAQCVHRDVHGFDTLAPAKIRQIYDKCGANDIRTNAPNQIDTRLAGTAGCDQIVYQQYTFARFCLLYTSPSPRDS